MIVLKYNSTKWQVIGKIMNEPDPIVTKKEPLSAPVGNDRSSVPSRVKVRNRTVICVSNKLMRPHRIKYP
jgi:hypothetical protein